jgi:cell division septation protein DedD
VRILPFFLILIPALFHFGCVSSEETGAAAGRVRTPQRVRQAARTTPATQLTKPVTDSVRVTSDSVKTSAGIPRTPTFATRQDTIQASAVRRPRSSRIDAPIERPENPEYTIQLGAFFRAENALRAQKRARQRFSDQPIFNTFLPDIKLYRVSIGRFPNLKEAGAFRRSLKTSFPEEYALCWINYVAR